MEISIKRKRGIAQYFTWSIVIILVIISILILKNTIIALMSAFVLTYISYPLYRKLEPRLGKTLSAAICTGIVIAVFVVIAAAVILGVFRDIRTSLTHENLLILSDKVFSLPFVREFNIDLNMILNKINENLFPIIDTFFTNYLPSFLIFLLISISATYYLLKNWEETTSTLKSYMPFKNHEKVYSELSGSTDMILKGFFLIAIIETTIAMAAFYLLGVKHYLITSLAIGFFAIIPGIGASAVWIPMALFYIFAKHYYIAAAIILTGVIISIFIDLFFRAKYIGDNTEINPLIMLLGIIGGVSLFGVFGFLFGPLILNYTIRIIDGLKNNN